MRGWKFRSALVIVCVLAAAGCGGPTGGSPPTSGSTAPGTSVSQQTAVERSAVEQSGARSTATGQYGPENTVSGRCLEEAERRGEAGIRIQRPPEVPAYEVFGASGAGDEFQLQVVTPVVSRADLRLIAEELRARNRDHSALSVSFYTDTGGRRQSTGTAYVFNTREAACRTFGYSVEQQENIIREGNGIVMTSVEEDS